MPVQTSFSDFILFLVLDFVFFSELESAILFSLIAFSLNWRKQYLKGQLRIFPDIDSLHVYTVHAAVRLSGDPEMSQSEQNRRIAYGICRHFQSQVAAGVLGEDGNAGIESKAH